MKQINFKKLNARNLLAYYRAERGRYNRSISFYSYGFDGVDYMWDHSDEYGHYKVKYESWQKYLDEIKAELSTREHVQKKKKRNK